MGFIVVGGGVAGLVCSSVLSNMGMQVTLIDSDFGARPQWDHVHLLDSVCWKSLCTLVAGMEKSVLAYGAASGKQAVFHEGHFQYEADRIRPSRRCIDSCLLQLLPSSVQRVSGRVESLDFSNNGVNVQLSNGKDYQSTCLIDASGRSRISLGDISRIQNTQLDLHQGPSSGGYISVCLEGVSAPPGVIALRGRIFDTGMLLLKEEGFWRITLQVEGKVEMSAAMSVLEDFFSRMPYPELAEVFSAVKICGTPSIFGAVRAENIQWHEQALKDTPWLILGDALLTTPPWLGWGLGQLVGQLELLKDGFTGNKPISDIRANLGHAAHQAWLQATMKETLRGFLTS